MTTPDNNSDISALLADLRKNYIAEIPDKLDSIESIILQMDSNNDFNENYEFLYRSIHTLKGTAGTYGLHFITSVCHSMEDVLVEVGKNFDDFQKYGGNYWLKFVDLIRSVLQDIENDQLNLSAYEDDLTTLKATTPKGDTYENTCMVVTASSLYETLILQTFENYNIHFSFCNDGYEALGRLITEEYDIVISDYEIPFLNGMAIFGAIKLSDGKNRSANTVLLTSQDNKSFNRVSDPDYVIYKDKNFSVNLLKIIDKILK